jgi:hypothetical protein
MDAELPVFVVQSLLNAGKILGGFRYDILGTQASSCKHFHGLPEHERVKEGFFRIIK